MKFLALTLLCFANSAFGATNGYSLKMDLSMNGKHISSPHVMVKTGETATITQKTNSEESFVEVVATESDEQNPKGIKMKFVIGIIGSNGERTIVSKPQIVALENEAAKITVSEENGAEQVSLSVVVQRKTL